MAAQTIAQQVAELVGATAPNSLDDWAADAINRLYSLLPYDVLAPFAALETCNYGSGVSVAAVAQVSSVTPGGTFVTTHTSVWTVVINGVSISTPSIDADASASDICTAITLAINNNAFVNGLVSAADQTSYVRITSTAAGVEFSIISSCTTVGDNTLDNSTITANREQVAAYTELAAKNKRIFEVSRLSTSSIKRICEEVSPERYAGELQDSASMHYPTDYDPRWCKYSNVIKVLPATAGMIITARTIDFLTTFDSSQTAISTLPLDAEHLVVLDLSIRTAQTKLQALTLAALSSAVVVPTAPSAPSFTYSAASHSAVSATTLSVTLTPPAAAPAFAAVSAPAGLATAWSAFDTALTADDIELGREQLNKASSYLQQYQDDIKKESDRVAADLQVYQISLQRNIKQADITMQEALRNAENATTVALKNAENAFMHDVQEYTASLKLYEAQTVNYGQQIQTAVNIYQVNVIRIKTDIDRYMAIISLFKGEYLEHLFTKYGIDLRPKGKN